MTKQAAADPDYRVTLADVQSWESRNGAIPKGAIVFLRTGWGSRYGNRKAYFGDDTPGATDKLHFPSYGADAAKLLVEQRHVGAIAVDTASIDYGQSRDFIVHQIANGAGTPGLENIANLERVPERGAWVVALPMKIAGGSGGPLRIVALIRGSRLLKAASPSSAFGTFSSMFNRVATPSPVLNLPRVVLDHLRHDLDLLVRFLPVLLLDGLAHAGQSLDAVARVEAGRVDLMAEPRAPRQTFRSASAIARCA